MKKLRTVLLACFLLCISAFALCSCASPEPEFQLKIYDEGQEVSDDAHVVGSSFFQLTNYSAHSDDGAVVASAEATFVLSSGINANVVPDSVTYASLDDQVSLSLPGGMPGDHVTVSGEKAASGLSLVVSIEANADELGGLSTDVSAGSPACIEACLSGVSDGVLSITTTYENEEQAIRGYAIAPYESNENAVTKYLLTCV